MDMEQVSGSRGFLALLLLSTLLLSLFVTLGDSTSLAIAAAAASKSSER